jgi:hypothetical protein
VEILNNCEFGLSVMLGGVSFGINLCWGGWSSRIVAIVGEILGILLL